MSELLALPPRSPVPSGSIAVLPPYKMRLRLQKYQKSMRLYNLGLPMSSYPLSLEGRAGEGLFSIFSFYFERSGLILFPFHFSVSIVDADDSTGEGGDLSEGDEDSLVYLTLRGEQCAEVE